MVLKFRETGTTDDRQRCGSPRTIRTGASIQLVATSVADRPKTSTRRRSIQLRMSRTLLQRILVKDLKWSGGGSGSRGRWRRGSRYVSDGRVGEGGDEDEGGNRNLDGGRCRSGGIREVRSGSGGGNEGGGGGGEDGTTPPDTHVQAVLLTPPDTHVMGSVLGVEVDHFIFLSKMLTKTKSSTQMLTYIEVSMDVTEVISKYDSKNVSKEFS
ncbi:hypothetical protein FHG87_019258 [Trinorchestia longiramus]|nr:hypothetical protein FHG87_019258 [Trinorchestia longiramus]